MNWLISECHSCMFVALRFGLGTATKIPSTLPALYSSYHHLTTCWYIYVTNAPELCNSKLCNFRVTQFKYKKTEATYLILASSSSLQEWERNETPGADECWAITRAAELSRWDRWGPMVLESGFKPNTLVFSYVVNHMYTQFLFAENSNCAVLSGTQLLRKSASVRTSIIKQKLNTEHATYDTNIWLL